jgi:hypothetical protein
MTSTSISAPANKLRKPRSPPASPKWEPQPQPWESAAGTGVYDPFARDLLAPLEEDVPVVEAPPMITVVRTPSVLRKRPPPAPRARTVSRPMPLAPYVAPSSRL